MIINYLIVELVVPQGVIDFATAYYWIALIYLLVDLWKSKLDKQLKITWSLLAVFLSFMLPYYWYKYLWHDLRVDPEVAVESAS